MMEIDYDDFDFRRDFRGLHLSNLWNLNKDSLSKYIVCYVDNCIGWTSTGETYSNKEEAIAIVKETTIKRKNLGLGELPMKVIKVTVSTEVVE